MKLSTGKTTTNPNIDNAKFVMVELHSTKQIIKAVIGYSTEQDLSASNPSIKVGTEVLMIQDDKNNFFVINSLSQGAVLINERLYHLENDTFTYDSKNYNINATTALSVTATKGEIKFGAEEVLALLSEIITELSGLQYVDGNLLPVTLLPPSVVILEAIKARISAVKL